MHENFAQKAYFEWVKKMKDNKEILSSVLKTTQMGQVGIRAVMNYAVRPDLKNELKSQLREYDAIEQEAHAIASARGWEPKELDPTSKTMAKLYSRARFTAGCADSKIAAMMIQGNTRGMIKTIKNQHHSTKNQDLRIFRLSQKLLDFEKANIQQMQGYL